MLKAEAAAERKRVWRQGPRPPRASRAPRPPRAATQAYILLDVVQATVIGHKRRNLLSILDQLHASALSDGGVGLLGLNATAGQATHKGQQPGACERGAPRWGTSLLSSAHPVPLEPTPCQGKDATLRTRTAPLLKVQERSSYAPASGIEELLAPVGRRGSA